LVGGKITRKCEQINLRPFFPTVLWRGQIATVFLCFIFVIAMVGMGIYEDWRCPLKCVEIVICRLDIHQVEGKSGVVDEFLIVEIIGQCLKVRYK
jgi:hypothetical protein